MDRRSIDRITLCIAILSVLLTAGTFALCGTHLGIGALVGGLVSLLNWALLRWVVTRIAKGQTRSKASLMALLALKTLALMGLIYVLMMHSGLSPIGFAIGLFALVGGVIIGGLSAQMFDLTPPGSPVASQPPHGDCIPPPPCGDRELQGGEES